MAEQLYFSRDTKVYIEIGSAVWELPVLDGFSFSQATNTSEITLAEMEDSTGVSRRGRRAFNDSLAPAEWSFSTYVRPFIASGTVAGGGVDDSLNHHAVEEVLWALMAGDAAYTAPVDSTSDADFTGFTYGTGATTIDFDSSNKSTLGTANIYFTLGDANKKTYKLSGCVVNEASIDFEIDGLATINWSGFGSDITEASEPTATVYEAITATSNFIRNRLSILTVVPTDVDPDGDSVNELAASYDLTLTGGNVTISNNITYITPEELGIVNIPFGHVTGTRNISGNFTCYLNEDTASTNQSTDLWEDLKSITNVVTNSFALTFKIGGASAPYLQATMGTCHIDVPTHSIADVISLETNFNALPSEIAETDELVLEYKGVAV
jgi:hypothetical protein